MIGEIDIGGVFLPALLVWACAALIISLPLRWLLSAVGAYRFVWHRGLFDLCLLVILTGLVAGAAARFSWPHLP